MRLLAGRRVVLAHGHLPAARLLVPHGGPDVAPEGRDQHPQTALITKTLVDVVTVFVGQRVSKSRQIRSTASRAVARSGVERSRCVTATP
ncbi:MAG TPA: hypothetical protein VKF59_13110 [Candidatus Dormibacteraeota bacterium]|nr:hypothetical protein [Candidatus Dormibacteraeota bacterium]